MPVSSPSEVGRPSGPSMPASIFLMSIGDIWMPVRLPPILLVCVPFGMECPFQSLEVDDLELELSARRPAVARGSGLRRRALGVELLAVFLARRALVLLVDEVGTLRAQVHFLLQHAAHEVALARVH